MSVTQLALVEALKTKMRWQQARQTMLAENVANADTPHYRGQDLKKPDFSALVGSTSSGPAALKPVAIALTEPGHIAGIEMGGQDGFAKKSQKGDFEVRPNGNAVNLEDEMVKTSENQIDFQAVSTLYQKNIDLIKVAIGKK